MAGQERARFSLLTREIQVPNSYFDGLGVSRQLASGPSNFWIPRDARIKFSDRIGLHR
jgi:hypothetical protein